METNERTGTRRRKTASGSAKTDTRRKKTTARTRSAEASGTATKTRSAAKSSTETKKRRSVPAKKTASVKSRTEGTTRRRSAGNAPAVVYTPAQPFDRGRLLLQLVTVVAVVLALTFCMSIFFKVDETKVTVLGNEKYTANDIFEASGIQHGDGLLSFSKARAAGQIKAKLPYVDTVRIGIKLPDTVNIVVEELDVLYSVKDSTGLWWLITSEGEAIDQVNGATAGEYTNLLGITLDSPAVGSTVRAVEPEPQTNELGEIIPATVRAAEQLSAALTIVQYMEDESIIGTVTSVNVGDIRDIELWYGQQYQVKLGDTTQLGYKIRCMKQTVSQLAEYESGEIDVSFTIMPDQPMFTRFT